MTVGATNYPAALDDATSLIRAVNIASSTIDTGGVTNVATTVPVVSTAAFAADGIAWCGTEAISYTGKTSTSLTGCVRGFDNTTAASHAAGDPIYGDPTAASRYTVLQNAIIAVQTLVGTRTNPAQSGAVRLGNAQWITARNAANAADVNLWRLNSDNILETTARMYIADSGLAFIERNTLINIHRNIAAPTQIIPNIYNITEGKGDNATFIGVSGGYFEARDRTDVTGANKGVLYGLQVGVVPIVDRGNTPFDDCVGLVVSNGSTFKATEAIYIGAPSGSTTYAFNSILGSDAKAEWVVRQTTNCDIGVRLDEAIISDCMMRGPNDVSAIKARNVGNTAYIDLIRLNGADQVAFRNSQFLMSNLGLYMYGTSTTHANVENNGNMHALAFYKSRAGASVNTNEVIGDMDWQFRNSTGADVSGFLVRATVLDATNASEDTRLSFYPKVAGAFVEQLRIDSGVTINPAGADSDTIIQGDTDASLFYVDASTDRVGIGTASPNSKFNVNGFSAFEAGMNINNAGGDSDTVIKGDTDASLLYIDAGLDSIAIGNSAPTSWFDLKAGTTARAPMRIPAGTLLTTPIAGAIEYSTEGFWFTSNTTNGRADDNSQQVRKLTANSGNIGATIADYFAANSGIPTVAGANYEIIWYLHFTKNTAGTVVFTILSSTAPTRVKARYIMTPVGGIGTAGTPQTAGVHATTSTTAVLPASGSLTAGTDHYAEIRCNFTANTAGNVRLRATESAGTITPLADSYFTVRRIPADTGNFVA